MSQAASQRFSRRSIASPALSVQASSAHALSAVKSPAHAGSNAHRSPGYRPARHTARGAVFFHQPNGSIERTAPEYRVCRSCQTLSITKASAKFSAVSQEQIRSRRLSAKNFPLTKPNASSQRESASRGALRQHLVRASPAFGQCWRCRASKSSVNEGRGHPAATRAITSSPFERRGFASREGLSVCRLAPGRQCPRGACHQVSAIAFGAGSRKC